MARLATSWTTPSRARNDISMEHGAGVSAIALVNERTRRRLANQQSMSYDFCAIAGEADIPKPAGRKIILRSLQRVPSRCRRCGARLPPATLWRGQALHRPARTFM